MASNKRHRQRAYQHYGDFCFFCGADKTRTRMSLDHLLPRGQGGTRQQGNVVPACWNCNQQKGDMTLEEYRTFLQNEHGSALIIFAGES